MITRKVESRIEAALPGIVGPAESYQARVDAGIGDMMRSRLRAVHVVGKEVAVTPDLTVETLLLDLEGVAFDRGRNELREIKSARIRAEITAAMIERYLRRARPDVDGISVTILRDEIRVTAKPRVLGLRVPISAVGKLETVDSSRINFVPNKVQVGGVSSPRALSALLAKSVNPVVDLSKVGYSARLTEISLEPAKVVLKGTAEFHPEASEGTKEHTDQTEKVAL